MSRVCLVLHQLDPSFAWPLAFAFAQNGAEVTVLHTGLPDRDTRGALERATPPEVSYRLLSDFPAAWPMPLFPAAEAHQISHHVSAALRTLAPDICVFLDAPAHAAIPLATRRTGLGLTTSKLIVAQPPAAQEQFPVGGRHAMVRDFFERRVLQDADYVVPFREPQAPDDLVAAIAAAQPRVTPPSGALPRVSVCVPYFEQPQFLNETLAMIAAQHQPPHEVIVVDDGSRTAEAAAAFEAARARHASPGWKFIRQENAGPAAARNRAAQAATGDCLLFCDADNRFKPEMLGTLARAFVATRADCVTCCFQTFRSAGDPTDDPGYVFAPLGPCLELALLENVLGDTNFLVRRDLFLALGGFPEDNRAASEDWQFLLELIRRGHRLETVPAVLFEYRLASGSHARRHSEFASAATAMAPTLAAAEPAWRQLWPHAAGAVRNRLPQLEEELRATEARLSELARTKKWELTLEQSIRRREQEQTAKALATERARVAELRDLAVRLQQQVTELDGTLRQRDDKIRRMQDSFSWRITASLRALRRSTVDRINPPPASPTAPTSPPPKMLFSVDQPSRWDAAPTVGTLKGWSLFGDSVPARDIRVQVNGADLSGKCDLARTDVVDAHKLPATARKCGFEFPYRLPADLDHRVRIEAQSADGRWHLLRDAVLHTSSRPRDIRDYSAWVEVFGTMTPQKASALRSRLAALPKDQQRLISVVMPVHNTPERWLIRALESVREQIYDNWELCIADDASTAPHIRPVLESYAARDRRIRVVFRPENGHISAASNSALELVRGEFVALLDHDDELAPDALAEVALHLATHPGTDVLYSDEDKIDEEGRRFTPYFKPDYLPDLLLGQNCLSHLSVFRTALLRKVSGFRVGYEGSQDWDLALRVIEQTVPERVRHLPKVLYHWRAISGSTALAVSEKDYSLSAARRALLDHFARRGLSVEVRPVPGSHWQIVYPLPKNPPLVSIIIPTRNGAALVRTCVASIIARTEYPRYEILLVNNRSDDPETLALFDEFKQEDNVRVIDYDAPFNYSAVNNFAVRHARGEIVCLLNNDIEVITGRWLDEMASHAVRPEIGAVGAMLYYPNNTIQHAGIVLGLGGVANHAFVNAAHGDPGQMNRARLAQNYSAVTGACMVMRREIFERVGGFNETELGIAFNDVDLCLRIRAAGYRNLWTPFAELYHHESASRGKEDTPEKQARFAREVDYMRRTWGPQLDHDPAYNVNLALSVTGWDLAWPPRE